MFAPRIPKLAPPHRVSILRRAAARRRERSAVPAPLRIAAIVLAFAGLMGCKPDRPQEATPKAAVEQGALFRVGSVVVYESDLAKELEDRFGKRTDDLARKQALDELVKRAQTVETALAAKLDRHPSVRAQFARALTAQLREERLAPRLKALNARVPKERLQELYDANRSRFQFREKRQAAVLWLDPGQNSQRRKDYEQKLEAARQWFLGSDELTGHPEKGFSVLSVDHSEHAESRYKGGVLGWLERDKKSDPWTTAVSEIVFDLQQVGEVSAVASRPEGVFLVRYMAMQPANLRSFESVAAELEQGERQRLRKAAEAEFEQSITAAHPVEWLNSSAKAVK